MQLCKQCTSIQVEVAGSQLTANCHFVYILPVLENFNGFYKIFIICKHESTTLLFLDSNSCARIKSSNTTVRDLYSRMF